MGVPSAGFEGIMKIRDTIPPYHKRMAEDLRFAFEGDGGVMGQQSYESRPGPAELMLPLKISLAHHPSQDAMPDPYSIQCLKVAPN